MLLFAGCGTTVDTSTSEAPTSVVIAGAEATTPATQPARVPTAPSGSAPVAPVGSAPAAPDVTPPDAAAASACQALSGMRLSQFVIQSITADTPEQDRTNAHYYIDNTMGAVTAAAPDLKPAADRMLA